eukprot:12463002-Alexandrium_andersonii.AAC.1
MLCCCPNRLASLARPAFHPQRRAQPNSLALASQPAGSPRPPTLTTSHTPHILQGAPGGSHEDG